MTDELIDSTSEAEDAPIETQEPSWHWDEGIAGTGDRPDYLASKFKSVADAAKSYNQLEKKLGSAPKEYSFDIAKDWLDPDFEPLKEAAAFAKDKHVSQDVIDNILGAATLYMQQGQVDTKAEIEKLGPDGAERAEVLTNWAKSNLSESAFNTVVNTFDTAEAIKAIEEIRSIAMGESTMVPPGNDAAQNSHESIGDIQQEMIENLAKYKSDPSYRKQLTAKFERATSGLRK